ncbi:MAG: sulfatase-like hydrolase/transferase [Bacteroidota bacterium]|nr:sulfatase-like hydrolase/transferase [Bacteroidota bacterium]MXW15197.1 sulfatase-like hydrolase/transferase [Rhodothermaceae bacterium]MYC03846.1 sulfatase-like hydrolase/transferase [Rhodothermaceae bacterium]MYI16747.1 sulfatase-like hydrolase/transferase [Rhodothermaceae bacterium]
MQFIRLSLILFLFLACNSLQKESPDYDTLQLPNRPNILWIVAEDMSPTIPAYGDSTIQTPNLDRLFNDGVRYTRMFSVSGVCAPSRFSIATGIYTTRGGAQHMRTSSRPEYMEQIGVIPYEATPDPPVRMMSEVMRENGYYTTNNSKQDYQFKAPVMAWDENSRQAHWKNRPEDMPFFSVVNIGVTHESQIWVRANDSLLIPSDLDVPIPPYLPNTELVRADMRRMYSNILLLDARVGAILDELEADGLLEETIVMFYSDHGGPLPRQKRQLYDSGLHVPLAIRFPDRQLAELTDEQLISFVDLAPTVFSLTGAPMPDYPDGKAFLGDQRAEMPRQFIHAAADRFDAEYDTKRAVRDHRFKYIRNLQPDRGYYLPVTYREQMATMQELLRLRDAGELDKFQSQWFRSSKPEEELFDTEADPHELFNLAEDPAYAEQLVRMRIELDHWMSDTSDPGTMDEMDFVASQWPGHIQPQSSAVSIELTSDGANITRATDDSLHYRITLNTDHTDSVQLRLTTATEGASIGYQTLEPSATIADRWLLYTSPVTLPPNHTLKAVAHRIGYAPSGIVTVGNNLK